MKRKITLTILFGLFISLTLFSQTCGTPDPVNQELTQ
jgi:hypothetical protein